MRFASALLAATIGLAGHATVQAQPATVQTAEPINPARLKSAEAIAAQILPDGTYAKVMAASLDGMMKPMLDMVGNMPLAQVAALGGLSQEEAAQLGAGTIKELNAIVDPAFEQRMTLMTSGMLGSMTQLMTTMEPSMREGLGRAFARRYSAEQLVDITRFFATPTGRTYAADSMTIFTDPEVMTKMMEMLPKMMEQMPAIMKDMETQMASLPKVREWGDLTSAEKAKVAKLLGTTVAEIEERQQIQVEENTDAAM